MAGGTAASVASWLSPVLMVATAAILGRAHYLIYALKRGNTFSTIATWFATIFVVAYWSYTWLAA